MGFERGRGAERLAERVAAFATTSGTPLEPVLGRLRRPVRVVVDGRRGVGRRTVQAALSARGVCVAAARPDLRVVVLAETLKPEDRALLAESLPTLLVLNKADVLGTGPGGPLSAAGRRAAEVAEETGQPVAVLVGLLATLTDLDAESVEALRTMVTDPAELSSVDAFVSTPHRVSSEIRTRLLHRLDRFGVAHAVVALAQGAEPASVIARLHALSNVDAVLADLRAVAAPVRYRRMQRAIGEMHCLAISHRDEALSDLLASDDVIDALACAAVDVLESRGLAVAPADDAQGHAALAVHWATYARGPVDALHRSCAADLIRGSLRRAGKGFR